MDEYLVNKRMSINKRNLRALLLAFLFSLLIICIPWQLLNVSRFVDLGVYIDKFSNLDPLWSRGNINSLKAFFFNEVLFDVIVRKINSYFGVGYESIFLGFGFVCLLVMSVFLIKKHGCFSLFFLLNPLIIDLVFSQIRSALALTLFIVGVESKSKKKLILFLLISCFIHTSFLLFGAMYTLSFLISSIVRYLGLDYLISVIFSILVGFFIALLVGPLREPILSFFGDRRAVYVSPTSSFLYISIWFVFFVVMVFQGRAFYKNNNNLYSLMVVSLALFSYFFNIYSTRFLAVGFVFMISSLMSFSFKYKCLMLCFFVPYIVIQWRYWILY